VDRRRHFRYDLSAFVTFSWKEKRGVLRRGAGISQNISTSGMFVQTETFPRVGDAVRLRACLGGSNFRIALKAAAKVLRVETQSSRETWRGFAVSVAEGFVLANSSHSPKRGPKAKGRKIEGGNFRQSRPVMSKTRRARQPDDAKSRKREVAVPEVMAARRLIG
jgi:PilZ domain